MASLSENYGSLHIYFIIVQILPFIGWTLRLEGKKVSPHTHSPKIMAAYVFISSCPDSALH